MSEVATAGIWKRAPVGWATTRQAFGREAACPECGERVALDSEAFVVREPAQSGKGGGRAPGKIIGWRTRHRVCGAELFVAS